MATVRPNLQAFAYIKEVVSDMNSINWFCCNYQKKRIIQLNTYFIICFPDHITKKQINTLVVGVRN